MLGSAATCPDGNSCCDEDHRCDVGEGDCDFDKDCLEGLKCGKNNCLVTSQRGDARRLIDGLEGYVAEDDCCFKPGRQYLRP